MDTTLMTEDFIGVSNPTDKPFSTSFGAEPIDFAPGEKRAMLVPKGKHAIHKSWSLASGVHQLQECDLQEALDWQTANKKPVAVASAGPGMVGPETLEALKVELGAALMSQARELAQKTEVALQARLTETIGKNVLAVVLEEASVGAAAASEKAAKEAIGAALEAALKEALEGLPAKLDAALDAKLTTLLSEGSSLASALGNIVDQKLPALVTATLNEKLGAKKAAPAGAKVVDAATGVKMTPAA